MVYLIQSEFAMGGRSETGGDTCFFCLTARRVLAILPCCSKFGSTKTRGEGRIAQLGERFPYKEEVTGSSPVSPTKA